MENNQKYEFNVEGMHCKACEMLLEEKLSKHKGVKKVSASLANQKIEVEGKFEDVEKLASELTEIVRKDGYEIKTEVIKKKVNFKEFFIAIPIGILFLGLLIIFQKSGVLDLGVGESKPSYPFIFLIGIIASLSTCMAVVGGLVLSLSATYAKESKKGKLSQVLFHISRLTSFFILGGVLGLLGGIFNEVTIVGIIFSLFVFSFLFTFSKTITFRILNFLISIVVFLVIFFFFNEFYAKALLTSTLALIMIVLAFNMMDIFPFFKKFQPSIPKSISNKALSAQNISNIFAPIVIGMITFFLPCGFTNAMQFVALGTRSFIDGALIMFVFALGTFPVLALISFASMSLSKSKNASVFFKTAGVIVFLFGFLNLWNALSIVLLTIGISIPVIGF